MKQPRTILLSNSKDPIPRGDYQLARAKRELEKRLREDGASKSEALRWVSEQFVKSTKL